MPRRRTVLGIVVASLVVLAAAAGTTAAIAGLRPPEVTMPQIVPQPVSLTTRDRAPFELVGESRIIVDGAGAEAVGEQLASAFRSSTGFELPVIARSAATTDATTDAARHDIALTVAPGSAPIGHEQEGYALSTGAHGAALTGDTAEGLFRGIQTLRQLFPPSIESSERVGGFGARWLAASVDIEDYPRFAYRGAMLDVARHFFDVTDVKRYIDDIALLKTNHLHLHLTDDQGWRIEIDGWPKLTEVGGTSSVNDERGGFYTKADYAELVAYAQRKFITIVPEIDLPGHTNAALASYPELTCSGQAPALYTGIEVGFSTVCINSEETYRFVSDVVRQVAAMTPGPYLHLGGDESLSTPEADFVRFIERVTADAALTGKTIIGWHEMGAAKNLPPGTIGQYWSFTRPQEGAEEDTLTFVQNGGQVILSPADVVYLDMVYETGSPFGQAWAEGPTSVRESYGWKPTRIIDGVDEDQILGIEAPIWTETMHRMQDVEYMAFPRLASVMEIAWSPMAEHDQHDFEAFAPRAVAFSERLEAAGITVHRAPDLPWTPAQ
ncbi:family 20 glycosylhydrolase [Leifsonia sp. Leaf264]|uniref:family 20 glycosylhydrolase n=1 Tax=Leifsonia sp. Leaf264 TaxID=1736314 RepID=UPI000AC8C4AD|nr:family 20 glycosylhydrolase [Leifsonia sp. Leaf264]